MLGFIRVHLQPRRAVKYCSVISCGELLLTELKWTESPTGDASVKALGLKTNLQNVGKNSQATTGHKWFDVFQFNVFGHKSI